LPPHPSVVFICPWLDAARAGATIAFDIFFNFVVVKTTFFESAFAQEVITRFTEAF
jgi:hypothetical protein